MMESCKAACAPADRKIVKASLILEQKYLKFSQTESDSLLKEYLTKEVFDKLKVLQTKYGSLLLDCVQSGLELPESEIGLYAADPDCYKTFAPLFDPIIQAHYMGYAPGDNHPGSDWYSDDNDFPIIDHCKEYIIAVKMQVTRSIEGYPFNPVMKQDQYREIETLISNACSELDGPLKGKYFSLKDMPTELKKKLIEHDFLFDEQDKFLQAAHSVRFWPTGRGIFFNRDKTFFVWCNEEEHLKLLVLQQVSDIRLAYELLGRAVAELDSRLKFVQNEHLGYVNSCPTNLGTAFKIAVHIRLPRLSANKKKIREIVEKYRIEIADFATEENVPKNCLNSSVYELTNAIQLGATEYEIMQEMYHALTELLTKERIY